MNHLYIFLRKINILIILLLSLTISAQTQIGADIDGEAPGDQSGRSVSMSADGTRIAIGSTSNNGSGIASGHVRVYEFNSGVWSQLGSDIDGEDSGDQSGTSVSLSADGSILAIGAPFGENNGITSGHVRIFEFSGGAWVQLGNDIDGEAAGDQSGASVSLSADGTKLAIGAPFNNGVNGNNSGHVRVYEYNAGAWSQLGSDIEGEASFDQSGIRLSLCADGSKVAIGSINNFDSGHVRVYEFNSGVWSQLGIDIDGEDSGDQSGTSVSLSADGSKLAIGGWQNDGNGVDSGHVRVYEFNSGVWSQLGNDIDGEAADDQSGISVNLNDDASILAIGALENDGNGFNSGHVRIYQYSAGIWTQLGNDIDGEAAGDFSGFSTSLSVDGNKVAIGASFNDGNGTDSGHVRVYEIPTLSINDNLLLNHFQLYPNPSKNGILNLKIKQSGHNEVYVQIFDLLGQNILTETQKIHNGMFKIDASKLSNGVYVLKINQGHKNYISKFIIE